MLLSIIIVNYRTTALIIDCIGSVKQFNNTLDYEIIVVDNDSKDDSKNEILQSFPGVKWIAMGYNAGFARANNAGIKAATGHVFLLLNPDTIAVDDSITQCYQKLIHSNNVAAGVQLLNEERSPQISGNFLDFVKQVCYENI
jgi:GT2 family glycosyltransferase